MKLTIIAAMVMMATGCAQINQAQQAAQTYINAYCEKPIEQRTANRILFNQGLNGHEVRIQCKGDLDN